MGVDVQIKRGLPESGDGRITITLNSFFGDFFMDTTWPFMAEFHPEVAKVIDSKSLIHRGGRYDPTYDLVSLCDLNADQYMAFYEMTMLAFAEMLRRFNVGELNGEWRESYVMQALEWIEALESDDSRFDPEKISDTAKQNRQLR